MIAPVPHDEFVRLRALHSLEILDTEPEPIFDRITQLAAHIYGTPIATITLIDSNRQWFKSCVGLPERETSRDIAFCAHAILQAETLVIRDAREDPRFANYPNVIGPPHIRFYAGAPLITSQGFAIGTLCVIDQSPRQGAIDTKPLEALAQTVAVLIEQRLLANRLQSAQESLLKAKQEAERANNAKSAFLAAMSHEIRTPLNAILGMADVLAETSLTKEQAGYVSIFRRAGTNLLALINNVLDLSKVEAGRLELENIAFDLPDLIATTIELIRPRLKSDRVSLRWSIADGVPKIVMGDPLRLQQILINLLGNAAKFTDIGSVSLLIEPVAADGFHRLQFTVSDTGIGIAKDKLSIIFDDFAQAGASTARQYGGTGLGLGIAKSLISMMGGVMEVDSTLGAGTTFRFTASFAPATLTPSANETHVLRPEPKNNGARRLLVAEDCEDNRALVEAYLSNSGHEVSFACDGRQAVDLFLHEGPFDLIFMDREMPVLNGLEATRLIREIEAREHRSHTPIVALTANALSTDNQASIAAGADGHLAKPISKQKLLAAIEESTAAPSPQLTT